MERNNLGPMVDAAMRQQRIGDAKLSVLIGLSPAGRVYDRKQVTRLRRGEVRYVPGWLLDRVIEVLGLQPLEAYRAAYPEVTEAVLTAVGGGRPTRAAGAQPAADQRGSASAWNCISPAQALTARKAA